YVPHRTKVLEDLKKAAEMSGSLFIATDPDREGEAIGWQLAQELGMPKTKTYRIMFNEITERAVKAAFQHPGKIDGKKVDAQQARRVLDRLVGYKLSPLLWEKIRRGLSAGRRPSVAGPLLTQEPPGPVGGPRAVGGGAAHHRARAGDPGLRAHGVLVPARPAQRKESPGVHGHTPRGQGREGEPAVRGRDPEGHDGSARRGVEGE